MHRVTFAVGMVAILAAVAGCAAATPLDDTAVEAATATPSSTTSETTVTDKESCEAFSDVSTIVYNATVDLNDGRMTQQEHDGWLRLATRVLNRVPTTGEGAVSEAMAAIKAIAAPVPAESSATTNIGAPEYNAVPLADACKAAGNDLPVQASPADEDDNGQAQTQHRCHVGVTS